MRSFDDMNRIFDELDRTFEQLRSVWWETTTPVLEAGNPTLEAYPVFEDESGRDATVHLEDESDQYVFVMDLPGFEREDIDLTFEGGVLAIRAHTEVEDGSDAIRTMRSRRVAKHVPIAKSIVIEEITAIYRNGVLEVHLPIVDDEHEDGGHRIDVE